MLCHNIQQLLLVMFSTIVDKTELRVKAPSKLLLLSHFPPTRVAISSPQMFIFLEWKYQGVVTFILFHEIIIMLHPPQSHRAILWWRLGQKFAQILLIQVVWYFKMTNIENIGFNGRCSYGFFPNYSALWHLKREGKECA